jgi:hypothetical protein
MLVAVVFVRVSQIVTEDVLTSEQPTPRTEVPGTCVDAVATNRGLLPLMFRPVTVNEVGTLAADGVMLTRPVTMLLAWKVPTT